MTSVGCRAERDAYLGHTNSTTRFDEILDIASTFGQRESRLESDGERELSDRNEGSTYHGLRRNMNTLYSTRSNLIDKVTEHDSITQCIGNIIGQCHLYTLLNGLNNEQQYSSVRKQILLVSAYLLHLI
jgi:hypothetical protein